MTSPFDRWFAEVDRKVRGLCGLSVHDLADMPFYDWFEDGVSALSAAKRTIRGAMD